MKKYLVIENRKSGKEFIETVLFAGSKQECAEYEHCKRKEYADRIIVDCFVTSEEEYRKAMSNKEFYDSLTDAEKKETIVVDGKEYNKALYERNNK